ncbi:CPBP family glutamic-type intramembrane protease [Aliterella atlantica]|nr:CPBP family glutamic-type intramembrane protease [Aliterella atlantica]
MLFTIVWLMGMTGVVSLYWLALPIPKETQLSVTTIKLLALIQPTLLLTLAVFIGGNLAPKVGLSAPLTEAISQSDSWLLAIKPQILPGIVGGTVSGIALFFISTWWKTFLPADFLAKGEALSENTPLLTRILYGGVTEEILLRWGLMTLLVWVLWRLLQRGQGVPSVSCFVMAIASSALLFALGHLPLAFILSTEITSSLLAYIIIGNGFFGLVAGYLYWQYGLESAAIAHILVHIVMAVSDRLSS